MMNILRKLAPHGAILIANMYYVFWGIDRVNRAMNFIDNEYTKGLFLILLGFTAVNLVTLYKTFSRWSRGKSDGALLFRLGLMLALLLFATVYFILWVVDCFAPHKMLMLNGFVKTWMLILCLLSTLSGVILAAQSRFDIRHARAGRAGSAGSAGSARRQSLPRR